jgi:hypothetical protein
MYLGAQAAFEGGPHGWQRLECFAAAILATDQLRLFETVGF